MSFPKISRWIAVVALALSLHSVAEAGDNLTPFHPIDWDPNLQLFAPADLGYFGKPPAEKNGWFFTYERVTWFTSRPDRTPVGVPGDLGAVSDGVFLPTLQPNSVQTAVPQAGLGWGNRYDIGYFDGRHGWKASFVEGLNGTDAQFHGFGKVDPLNPLNDIDVFVIFDDPLGVLSGFVDIFGDGFDDDINGNGVFGADGIDTTGDGIPDTPAPPDDGDIVAFPLAFSTLITRNVTKVSSFELMKALRVDPLKNSSYLELSYGVRLLSITDIFSAQANRDATDFLTEWKSSARNWIVGPQVGMKWSHKTGRWTVGLDGKFMFGANIQDKQVKGFFDQDQIFPPGPSPPNPAPGSAISHASFHNALQDVHFAPTGELRFNVNFQLSKSAALTAGWTGIYAGQVARGASIMNYTYPSPTINSGRNQGMFTNGFNFGFVINQ